MTRRGSRWPEELPGVMAELRPSVRAAMRGRCAGGRTSIAQTGSLFTVRHAIWIGPWIGGQVIIGALGRYGDGSHSLLPQWWDLVVVIAFSVVIFYWAVSCVMPRENVQEEIAKDADQIDYVAIG